MIETVWRVVVWCETKCESGPVSSIENIAEHVNKRTLQRWIKKSGYYVGQKIDLVGETHVSKIEYLQVETDPHGR